MTNIALTSLSSQTLKLVEVPYYMKSIRHIYRTHDYRTTCNSYELLLGKIQNLGQILIPLKFLTL